MNKNINPNYWSIVSNGKSLDTKVELVIKLLIQ